MKRIGFASFVLVMGLTMPAAAQFDGTAPQGPLNAAKDLYASARYDEALSVLNGLRAGDAVDRKSVEQYRSLCLLALGRASEAETAIAAVVTADPTYRPDPDVSPRVRSSFTDVRKRLLPDIITSRYQSAKALYDRKDWIAAEEQFRIVLALLDDPDNNGRLGDMRVLTAGFLELSARAAAPPPVEPAPAPAPVIPPVTAPEPAPAPGGPIPGKVYGAEDAMVRAPVVVKQDIPSVPQNLMTIAKPRGLLEVVIDEQGRVVAMTMRGSIHPSYDAMVLGAARDWKYQPARFNGEPVRYRRLISIAVTR
jgi:tetratricopeptide (TPR) repeat protein